MNTEQKEILRVAKENVMSAASLLQNLQDGNCEVTEHDIVEIMSCIEDAQEGCKHLLYELTIPSKLHSNKINQYIISHWTHGVFSRAGTLEEALEDLRQATQAVGPGYEVYDAQGRRFDVDAKVWMEENK